MSYSHMARCTPSNIRIRLFNALESAQAAALMIDEYNKKNLRSKLAIRIARSSKDVDEAEALLRRVIARLVK